MSIVGHTFNMREDELVVLTAFFLALPLPPLMAKDKPSSALGTEDRLRQAALALREKKWVYSSESESQSDQVLPELAELLRDMAYGNQMVHVYYHRLGNDPQELAFYRNQDQVVYQELANDGRHRIRQAEISMGWELAEKLLIHAPEGKPGAKIVILLVAWHYLLSSRITGIADEVLAVTAASHQQADGMEENHGANFAKDVFEAPLVLEVTLIYDRLRGQMEKASFVLGRNENWLVGSSAQNSDQTSIGAFNLPKRSLLQTLASLYAPLISAPGPERSHE